MKPFPGLSTFIHLLILAISKLSRGHVLSLKSGRLKKLVAFSVIFSIGFFILASALFLIKTSLAVDSNVYFIASASGFMFNNGSGSQDSAFPALLVSLAALILFHLTIKYSKIFSDRLRLRWVIFRIRNL